PPANIALAATAGDTDGTVGQVELFAGTNSLGVDTTSPFALTWTNVPTGMYSLTAKATDNLGVISTSAVVNIIVDVPPTIALTNPANAALFIAPANISLNASAADTDGTIAQVEFFQGANSLG